jgi:hypothetical protein
VIKSAWKYLFIVVVLLAACSKSKRQLETRRISIDVPGMVRSIDQQDSLLYLCGGSKDDEGFIISFSKEFLINGVLQANMENIVYDFLFTNQQYYFPADHHRVYQGVSINDLAIYYPDSAYYVNTLNKKALREIVSVPGKGLYMAGGAGYSKGLIQFSPDSGMNWHPYELDHEMRSITLQEPATIWCGGYGILLKSDHEHNWEISPFENSFITGIDFFDEQNAVICTYDGEIYQSKTGGDSWDRIQKTSLRYNKIAYLNASLIFAVGNNGSISYSKDGGDSWINNQEFDNANLKDFIMMDGEIYIVGDEPYVYVVNP